MARQNTPGSPFIHDNVTNDIIGIKDADGGEKRFVYTDDLGVFFSGQIDITDTTASTSSTTGALTVAGGVGVAGDTYLGGALRNTATTASTSTTTGATVISGGLGVAGAAYVGGVANVAGVATMANVTDSTTKDNGALVVEGGVGIEKRLNVGGAAAFTGGLTSIPNASAPTSNVVMGPSAGAAISGAANNVLIGSGAGDTITGGSSSVAIGTNALGAQVDGVLTIANTVAGTGMTPGDITAVQLVKDSGTHVMAVYPIVTLTVGAGGDVTAVGITTRGSGATGSNIVFKTDDVRVDPAWRGTLGVLPANTAVGASALASNTYGSANSACGLGALNANTTGFNNAAFGQSAMSFNTTGKNTTAVGQGALQANTTGNENVAVGWGASGGNTTGIDNTAVGAQALQANTTGSGNTAVGLRAGSYFGPTNLDPVTVATNSVFIGLLARANADSQTNQVVIGGVSAVGDGSNTTVINNSSTTSTRIGGTATSLLAIAGDTMRITGTRNPASNAAGTAGDFAFGSTGGSTYLYYCIASGNWGRVALTTGY